MSAPLKKHKPEGIEDTPREAKTVQTYLASSAFGNFKEVVSLLLVFYVTGKQLTKMIEKVIDLLVKCGLIKLVIISNNNRIHRTVFNLLQKEDALRNPGARD